MKNHGLKDHPGRIGDRFRCSLTNHWFIIWEIVGPTDDPLKYVATIVEYSDGTHPDESIRYNYWIDSSDTYLGNFAKSENFNSLYEKLQGN